MPLVPILTLGPAAFDSPLQPRGNLDHAGFVTEDLAIRYEVECSIAKEDVDSLLFEKAGPRSKIYFEPRSTSAAIVTCGGLCPGINNVIRSLYYELFFHYGVAEVLGIKHGFQGLIPAHNEAPIWIDRNFVTDIHRQGGTILGSSRGQQDPVAMVDFLLERKVDILFCIGGDGTQRGAHAIHLEAGRRNYALAVVGVPKTIDNDIQYCDRSFGMMTATDKAREVLHLAHIEAKDNPRGVGLVKVMGRDAGFIACGATLASQVVNFTLIPECPFDLPGEHGFLKALERRMTDRGHAVVVVAEGAGQELFGSFDTAYDLSGNRRHHDIGLLLKEAILQHFESMGDPVDLKYIDPSYMIRSVPANSEDAMLCDLLARRAVDAAMSGRTDMIVSTMNGAVAHVPIPMAVSHKRTVDVEGSLWNCVLSATGQAPRYRLN